MKSLPLTVIGLLAFGLAVAETDSQPVLSFDTFLPAGGTSYLTRLDDKVLVTVEASNLNPGDAMTLWWVVWNNPAGCTGGACGDDEFDDPTGQALAAAGAAVGNASGNVVKSDGTIEFGATLHVGMNDPSHEVIFNDQFDPNGSMLTGEPDDVEFHVVLQTHGQARGGKKLSEQLSNLEANCTPSCQDLQFALHFALP